MYFSLRLLLKLIFHVKILPIFQKRKMKKGFNSSRNDFCLESSVTLFQQGFPRTFTGHLRNISKLNLRIIKA